MMRLIICMALLFSSAVNADIRWRWGDDFASAEASGLKRWIEHTDLGLQRLFGELPYDYKVHFHRRRSNREPVPWAETNKGNGLNAYFHVDTRHSWDAFEDDWTAAHELIHLLFPYIGEDSRWFAEGIATYLQYQVMYANETLSWSEAAQRMKTRLKRESKSRRGAGLSIVEQSKKLNRVGGHSRMYWGGAAYFLLVDQRLSQETDLRLTDVISRYRACCYKRWGVDAKGMMRVFDEISGSRIFSETYRTTVMRKGFPDIMASLDWLDQHPPPLVN